MSNPAVLRALYDLHEQRQRPPTATDLAEHLQMDEASVLAVLRDLREQRLFRDRRVKAGRVWEPWGGRW